MEGAARRFSSPPTALRQGPRGESDGPTVLYLDHVARWSGAEIALARLLAALDGRVTGHVLLGEDGELARRLERIPGVSVEVLAMDPELRDTRRAEIGIGRLRVRRLVSTARYVLLLRRRLHELKPDLVHTNSLKSALLGGLAGRLAGVPVLWHVRDRIAEDYLPRPAVWLVRVAARLLPTAVVANSASTLSTLPRRVPGAVLYNPVVPDIAPEPSVGSPKAERPLRVGVVGRLAEWKGQHVFLRAFAEAFPVGPEEAWLIGSAMFGETTYERSLRELADQLEITDRVVWRGFRDDVAAELAELDVLVHCSTTPEPFGQVIVEGMAAGLPVIAAAAGGPLEIISPGVDGFLTPPGDVAALAQAMRELADDPQRRIQLGEAARRSSQRFSPSAAADRIESVYLGILGCVPSASGLPVR